MNPLSPRLDPVKTPEEIWEMYKLGQISADHTAKEVFCDLVEQLTEQLLAFNSAVKEYVQLELADDHTLDDPDCQLFPLIELVRGVLDEEFSAHIKSPACERRANGGKSQSQSLTQGEVEST